MPAADFVTTLNNILERLQTSTVVSDTIDER